MAAINWVGQTNQRLYQCRLLQEQICAGQEPALQQALDDARPIVVILMSWRWLPG